MNNTVCENCIPKCIVVSLKKKKKIPKKSMFLKPDYQNTPLNRLFNTASFFN